MLCVLVVIRNDESIIGNEYDVKLQGLVVWKYTSGGCDSRQLKECNTHFKKSTEQRPQLYSISYFLLPFKEKVSWKSFEGEKKKQLNALYVREIHGQ